MKFQVSFAALSAFVGIALAQSQAYGQCGGIGWTGPTTCVDSYVCVKSNDYYSQCIPGLPVSTAPGSTGGGAPTSTSPSPPSQTTAPIPHIPQVWKDAWTKGSIFAQADVAKMSLEDKVNMGTGIGTDRGNCVGNTPAIESIKFPGLCLQDSPLGVRYADFVSAFPPAINVAATFNRTLMRQRGVALGEEFRGKGVHVALGPMMNIVRSPAAGRNWEGFGGDPYLSGEGAYETVMGVQSTGVQACAKHYINNEQEHFRETSSSNVDDRPEHEIYAAPFLRAVQANVASVMCSYNQINGSYACENDKTLNGIMKGEFGFQGYIMSDWWATHSTTSVNSGLDMTMPGDTAYNSSVSYFGPALLDAINSGQVSTDRMDDLATRILASWYLLGQDSGYPEVNFDSWDLSAPVNTHVNVQGDHASLIRTIGAASTILLKNTPGVLPLKSVKTIGIVGNDAGANPQGPNGFTDRSGDSGVLAMGWGSGTDNFPYLITPLDAITNRSQADGTVVTSSTSDTDLEAASKTAAGKDVALVFISADSGEGYLTVEGNAGDRNNLSAWHSGDALVAQVAGANDNTIVVINSVGAIDMEAWIDHPNVTAVVLSGLPGQEAGNALADVLYGDYNPSGRLPYTVGKSIDDYSAQIITSGGSIVQVPYTEGLMVDYRHFDAAGIEPRFEFGFGLSYTTFDYSDLDVSGSIGEGSPSSGPGSALDPWLHEVIFTISFTLKNNGSLAGHESPQLYTSPPKSAASAPYNLKGFDNVFLAPGESTTVSFNLSRYDLSVWNVVTQRWEIPTGTTGVSVGASSRDLRLASTIDN